MKKKRQISLKAIQAALKSPKTPEHLRAGLLRKYGHLFKNAPKEFHRKEADYSYRKFLKTRDSYDKGLADAHYASVLKHNPKEKRDSLHFYRGEYAMGWFKVKAKSPQDAIKKLIKKYYTAPTAIQKQQKDGSWMSIKYPISFRNPKEATDGYISERVKSPKRFDPRSFRTKRADSTLLTFGCPKGEWSPKKKKCKVPVELQRKLKAKRSNPSSKPELIYDKILAIEAVKGKKSHWPSEQFRHDFTSGAKIYGNPDGSLTIKGKKSLWSKKRYSEKDIKGLGGKV